LDSTIDVFMLFPKVLDPVLDVGVPGMMLPAFLCGMAAVSAWSLMRDGDISVERL